MVEEEGDPTVYQTEVTSDELEAFRRQWRQEVLSRTAGADLKKTTPAKSRHTRHRSAVVDDEVDAGIESDMARMAIDQSPSGKTRPAPPPSSTLAGMSTKDQALDIYIQGVQAENEGNLNKALVNYRKAFKMDNRVDLAYRAFYQSNLTAFEGANKKKLSDSSSKGLQPSAKVANVRAPAAPTDDFLQKETAHTTIISTLVQSISKENPAIIPAEDFRPCYLATLPEELLPLIIAPLFSSGDTASVLRFASACKAFFHVALAQEAGWKIMCERSFLHEPALTHFSQTSNTRRKHDIIAVSDQYPAGYPISFPQMSGLCSAFYSNSYRLMYMHHPRIRTDGCYISTCHYLRQGSSDNAWYQPVHLVKFHRYIRFWGDGHFIALLTTEEPKDIVRKLGVRLHNDDGVEESEFSWWKGRGLSYGKWWIEYNEKYGVQHPYDALEDDDNDENDDTRCSIPWAGEDARIHCIMHSRELGHRHTFFMVLAIRNSKNLKTPLHGRLRWVEYYSINNTTGDRSVYHAASPYAAASANATTGTGVGRNHGGFGNLEHQRDFVFSKVRSYGSGAVYGR